MTALRDRVVGLERVPASELQDNVGNWRTHPQAQRDGLRGLLESIGMAGALVAYRSARDDGALTLIDGHLRREDYPGATWPVLILDVDDAEADVLLASLDPLAAMAQADVARQAALLAGLENVTGDGLLGTMRAQADLEAALLADVQKMLDGGGRRIKLRDGRGEAVVRAVVLVADLEVFERAIRATSLVNRGAAVVEICRHYLESRGG